MDPHQEYGNVLEEGSRAADDKNFRLAADKFWKVFRKAPGIWSKDRLRCLQVYMDFFGNQRIMPTKKDYMRLETHVVNNEDEPNICRGSAALCLGFMYFIHNNDLEEAAECARHCLELCDSASQEEKKRVANVLVVDGTSRERQIGEVLDEVKVRAVTLLRRMETCEVKEAVGVQDPVRSPWSSFPRSVLVPIFGDIPTEQMERRMAAGGATCDACGVVRGSTDRKKLLVCSKCNMAFYCSKECQVEQWKRGGHKKACRRPREFHAEDVVRFSFDDMTFILRLKRLVDEEDGDGTPQWEASGTTKDGELLLVVVEEAKLNHIRPADIV